jgi:murein DD-endopeptidase MepM/ murein hydrolase activator NlpD
MHRGTDFAAPRGTPVYAAGDGVIELAGRKGAYGKYIRIRHNSTYKTAYAHLRGYAKKTRRGRRVKQGQVIAYVGSTGRSTGPHLHYEVMVNGRQVNPLKIRLPSGEKLNRRSCRRARSPAPAASRALRATNGSSPQPTPRHPPPRPTAEPRRPWAHAPSQ